MASVFGGVGWFVVHAAWQVTLVGGVLAFLLGLMRTATPRWRYRLAGLGLLMMVAAPLITMASGINSTRPRLPPATFEPIVAVIDMTVVFWWASVLIPIAGALYVGGAMIAATRLAREVRRVRHLREAVANDPAGAAPAFAATRPAWRLPAGTAIRTSDRVTTPMVVGWRRPLVLMPAPAPGDDDSGVNGLLCHELAHVVRRDYLANLVQVVADAVLFFHPVARWLSHRIRTEREYCCDDMALDAAPDRLAYVRALASLGQARASSRLAVLASSGTLLDRLRRIAGEPRRVPGPATGALALTVALLVAITILSAVVLVPPRLPWKAELRRRTPPPAGEMMRQPGPDAAAVPRTSR